MDNLGVLDLFSAVEHVKFARNLINASEVAKVPGDLPSKGKGSSLGYWIAPLKSWDEPPTHTLYVHAILKSSDRFDAQGRPGKNARPRESTAKLRLPRESNAPDEKPRWLLVSLSDREANVYVEPRAWPKLREAVLLVALQYWRFRILQQFQDLQTRLIRLKLERNRPSAKGLALWMLQQDMNELYLDLPIFLSAFQDPSISLRTHREVRIYRALSRRLGLPTIVSSIEHRIEYTDAALSALLEAQRHRALFRAEIVIVVLLCIGLGFHLYELFH